MIYLHTPDMTSRLSFNWISIEDSWWLYVKINDQNAVRFLADFPD